MKSNAVTHCSLILVVILIYNQYLLILQSKDQTSLESKVKDYSVVSFLTASYSLRAIIAW
jgi:hypothetical protein